MPLISKIFIEESFVLEKGNLIQRLMLKLELIRLAYQLGLQRTSSGLSNEV